MAHTHTARRHDAQYSPGVIDVLIPILTGDDAPDGVLVDPFAGLGLKLPTVGRSDLYGIELEPEWSAVAPWVHQGDALDPACYPAGTGSIVSSPCYGNRFADQYLGPACKECNGNGMVGEHPRRVTCPLCSGSGRDGRGRYGYAISLGRKVSEGSAAALQWGPKYQVFHLRWLRTIAQVLEPGQRRLVLNMSDHYRNNRRQHVCSWWLWAAHEIGFRMVEAWPADTDRVGHGQNHEKRAEREMVFVFDYLSRAFDDGRTER